MPSYLHDVWHRERGTWEAYGLQILHELDKLIWRIVQLCRLKTFFSQRLSGINLGWGPANGRRRYIYRANLNS